MSLITEEVADPSGQYVASSIAELHGAIARLPDFKPSDAVNQVFTDLVRLIVETPDRVASDVLGRPGVGAIARDLRELAGQAEAELEFTWARRIAAGAGPQAELLRFPYLWNYRKLCRIESSLIDAARDEPPRSVAFVGAGPLPVTALMLAGELGCGIVGIDRDQAALDAAAEMTQALGHSDVQFVAGDAVDVDLSGFDVVVLAAMVGTTPSRKRAILCHFHRSMRPDAVLLARSANGLRTLLYPQIHDEALAGFDVRAVVHPVSEVINSVVLARPAR